MTLKKLPYLAGAIVLLAILLPRSIEYLTTQRVIPPPTPQELGLEKLPMALEHQRELAPALLASRDTLEAMGLESSEFYVQIEEWGSLLLVHLYHDADYIREDPRPDGTYHRMGRTVYYDVPRDSIVSILY